MNRPLIVLLVVLGLAGMVQAEQQEYVVDDGATSGIELHGVMDYPSKPVKLGDSFFVTVSASLSGTTANNITTTIPTFTGCTLLSNTTTSYGLDVASLAMKVRMDNQTCSWNGHATATHTPTGVGSVPNTLDFAYAGTVVATSLQTVDNATWLSNVAQFSFLIWLSYFLLSRLIRGHGALRMLCDVIVYGLPAVPVPAQQFALLAAALTSVLTWDLIESIHNPTGVI